MGIKGRKIEWNEKVGELEDWGKMLEKKKKGWRLEVGVGCEKIGSEFVVRKKIENWKVIKNWEEKIELKKKKGIEIENDEKKNEK